VKGIDSIKVGSIETLATNQACSRNSRHANGGRNINSSVSIAIAKKLPAALTGLAAVLAEITLLPSVRPLNRHAAGRGLSRFAPN
jgi:hypothetical protein